MAARIGIILYGDLTYDSRVRREARSLAQAGYDVTIACLADGGDRSDLGAGVAVTVLPLKNAGLAPGAANPYRAGPSGRVRRAIDGMRWLRAYVGAIRGWGRAAIERVGPVDAWHLNDLTGLAAIVPFSRGGVPLIYDVHDLMLDTGTAMRLPSLARSALRRYEERLARRCAAVVTVNDGLAGVLRGRFPGTRVEVVHNCPERWTPPAGSTSLIRDTLRIPTEAPVVLYHGGLSPGRGIEVLIEAMATPRLQHAHLVLMGFGSHAAAYRDETRRPELGRRVHVLEAVHPQELLSWVMSADVGAVIHPGIKLNDQLKTPNKMFECIAAGIPVVISDFPLLRQIVLDEPAGPLGVAADPDDPESVSMAIRSLLDHDPDATHALRARILQAARTRWNWEMESQRMVALYRTTLGPQVHSK